MLGRVISHYEVVAKLGEGGMGVVYKARDTLLHRAVALKVLPPELIANEDRRRRFLHEARAISALNHPHIVTIHDVVSEGGSDFIIMELIEGPTLKDRIPPGGLPLTEALSLALQIADAMSAAHRAGIVHRDLKPGNVMIDADGRVRVLDFGLAKLEPTAEVDGQAPTLTAPMTRAGAVLGTLEYMSPEQAQGEPADARSDVFSFGAVLYEMVTGERPFRAKGLASMIHEVVYGEPVEPGVLRPDLPAELSGVVLKAMAKRPEERYQSFAELRSILDETASSMRDGRRSDRGVPAAASLAPARPPPANPPRSFSAIRGNAGRLGLAALVVVSGAALVLGLVPGARRTLLELLPARTGETSRAAEAGSDALPATAYEHYRQGNAYLQRYYRTGYLDKAVASFQNALELDPSYAPAYAGLARADWRRYRAEKDPVWLERARGEATHALELDPQLHAARVSLGLVLAALGEVDGAREQFDQVLQLDPANADGHRGLGDLLLAGGELAAAASEYETARNLRPDDKELHGLVGFADYRSGRYADAAAAFTKSVELAPDDPDAHSNLAAAYHMQGEFAKAAAELQKSVEIRPVPDVYSNLGTLYFFQGLYRQAVSAFERAIELGANKHQIWANLGDAHRWLPGHEKEARQAYERAVQLVREALGAEPGSDELRSRLALLLAKLGDRDPALATAAEVERHGNPDAAALYRLVQAYEIAGDRAQALRALARALDAGFSTEEVRKDPELTELRKDVRYHKLLVAKAPPEGGKRPS